jgi:succinoglycan biosynthesis protein ExoO
VPVRFSKFCIFGTGSCAPAGRSFQKGKVSLLTSVDMRISNSNTGRVDTPDVTFIVAAFNVAPFIEDAVHSALDQADARVEVIVVDDASTDGTADVAAGLAAADERVSLIRQAHNSGPGAARNAALKQARGRWISILDGDDFIVPGRTSALVACADATGADIVGDNFERVTFEGQPTGRLLFPTAKVPFLMSIDAPTFISANEVLGKKSFSLGAIKVIVRTDFLRAHDIWHLEDLPVGEDFQFILACLFRNARFVVTSEPSYKYRLRPGSQSWRLTDEHMEKLRVAYAAIVADAERSGNTASATALSEFGASLERTTDFVKVVSLAKGRRFGNAVLWALGHPHAWPLILKFGGQALRNKFVRLFRPVRAG